VEGIEFARLLNGIARFVEAARLQRSGGTLHAALRPTVSHAELKALPLRRRDVLGSISPFAAGHTSVRHAAEMHAKDVLRRGVR
jgi:hypothetical protein